MVLIQDWKQGQDKPLYPTLVPLVPLVPYLFIFRQNYLKKLVKIQDSQSRNSSFLDPVNMILYLQQVVLHLSCV